MYLSHPVRRLREDPHDGTVDLVIERGDATRGALAGAVAAAGGDLREDLGLGAHRVRVPAPAVDDLCERLDGAGIVRIETAAVIEGGDAGEDVRPGTDSDSDHPS